MNKALILIDALTKIVMEIDDAVWEGDEETLVQNIRTLAEDTVNMVGGREEIDFLYEDLRCKPIDLDVAYDHLRDYDGPMSEKVKRLFNTITPVLVAVDDLTDYGVTGA